jgi:predicted NBD/HSP70 family sugar kinase
VKTFSITTSDAKLHLRPNSQTALNNRPFLADLSQVLSAKVKIANDANCFALAETLMGVVPQKVPGAQVVFGIIIGTGVGGGIVVNGRVLNGLQGIAGEWGHNFLDASGGADYAGLHGCVETILAGPALQRWYTQQCGKERSLQDIVSRHRNGVDLYASETVARLIDFFGRAVAVVINILDPDAIVLGGGVSNIEELYSEGVESISRRVFNTQMNTPILRPALGDSAGVFGAALLCE